MALVTRYFDASGAGAADGTTWADRAVLFSGGSWSSVITGFSFAGSDALRCFINGNHTITSQLTSGSFTNAPTNVNRLWFHGCDTSGNALSVPDPDWVSAMPAWSATGLPVLTSDTSISTSFNLAFISFRLMKFVATRTATAAFGLNHSSATANWCHIEVSGNNTGSSIAEGIPCYNCVLTASATTFSYASNGTLVNCRVTATSKGSSGNRNGPGIGSGVAFVGNTVSGFAGSGVRALTGNNRLLFNTIRDCDGDGIDVQCPQCDVIGNMISGCGGYAVDGSSSHGVIVARNRLRDCTSGSGSGTWDNSPDTDNYTTDSDDATEYVDASGGDYRIKYGATIWDMGFGAGRQLPPAGGGTRSRLWMGG